MRGSTFDSIADGGSPRRHGRDDRVERLIAFLRREGAAEDRHAGGRTLLGHLAGTYEIVSRWDQPVWLQHAALIHSVYGTDVPRRRLLEASRRSEVIELAGERAERLAWLFSATPRRLLFAGTHVWASGIEVSGDTQPTRAELDALVLLHMANLAEQAQARDGSPAAWLVRLRELAEVLIQSEAVTLPLFVAGLASLTEEDETLCRRTYRAAVGAADAGERSAGLALAAAACPVVPEPCVWQAHLARCRGDIAMARAWAEQARRRLDSLGTAWDKRLSFEAWLELTRALADPGEPFHSAVRVTDPRALLDRRATSARVERSSPETGRFQRYLDILADADPGAVRGLYPDLPSQPWYDPSGFPLANYLEAHFREIRQEILALEGSRFQPESERIPRSGDWDVAFLYERGRRHDAVCDACPVTARAVETFEAMRTVAGLIYVSRMRPGTHIRAHRGPTNLRVRCHLGVVVPQGDCAVRVGGDTRRWTEGRCLVFDDYFEHEAWNHTDEDRIVLIVDLWHPGLSSAEVRLLAGLHRYAAACARQLNRYWAANAAAARSGGA